jgi:release factor glutamine methyltransferase
MSSLQKIKTGLTKRLEEGGVEAPSFEASLLLRHFLGLSKEELLAKDEIEAGKSGLAALQKALDRRLKGEPLQYILGRWEFMGLPFLVGPGVLIPRGDTEVLAERAIWDIRKKEGPVSVLDLCCGSGCIGIAVAAFCERAQVTMWDISEEALKTARENISLNNLAGRVRCEKNTP